MYVQGLRGILSITSILVQVSGEFSIVSLLEFDYDMKMIAFETVSVLIKSNCRNFFSLV